MSKVVGGKILEIDYLEDFDTNLGLYKKILESIESDTFEVDGFLDEMIEFVLDNYNFEYEDGVWIANAK